jgi:hypothetical protein
VEEPVNNTATETGNVTNGTTDASTTGGSIGGLSLQFLEQLQGASGKLLEQAGGTGNVPPPPTTDPNPITKTSSVTSV